MAMEKDLLIECPKEHESKKIGQNYDPFSSLGDLCDEPIIVNPVKKPTPAKKPDPEGVLCSACRMNNPKDAIFCEHCGKRLVEIPKPTPFIWKKWMTVASCCVVTFVILIFAVSGINLGSGDAVTGGAVDEFTPPKGYDERFSVTEEYVTSFGDGIYKMKEFNGRNWFCNVSIPAWSTIVSEKVDSGDYWNPYYLYTVNTENYDDFSFQSVTRGEDKLAIVGITGVSCAPIIEMDYTIPYKLGAYGGTIHYKNSIGYLIGGYDEAFEEINGQDPSKYLDRLSDYYNVFRAEKGEEFTFSYYSGTDYLEETVAANHFYYIIEDYKEYISLEVTKTTQGYFLVDYSELSPGYYWFSVGGDDTIIEIK